MLFPNGFCHFCPYHHLSRSLFNVFLSIWNGKSFVTYPEKKKNVRNLVGKKHQLVLVWKEERDTLEFQFLLCMFKRIRYPLVRPQRKYKTSGVLASLHQLDFSHRELFYLLACIVPLQPNQRTATNAGVGHFATFSYIKIQMIKWR